MVDAAVVEVLLLFANFAHSLHQLHFCHLAVNVSLFALQVEDRGFVFPALFLLILRTVVLVHVFEVGLGFA